MKFFKKISLSYFLLFIITIGLVFTYRQVIFEGKILFPSNFLAQFYSPWKTEKFPGWETGIPHKPIGDDQIRIFYPSRTFTNIMFEKKNIPLWNPYIFTGSPHMADFQSAVFYPLNIIYFFLPQIIAWSFLLFIQPIMAAFFMYLFLGLFRLNKSAIWLGSIAYGFSGFILLWSQENAVVAQSALWLPLVLFGIEGYLKNKKLWYYCVATIALACSILGGFFQVTFYIFIFSFSYSLFRIIALSLPIGFIFKVTGIYIFSLCLSAIQLIPSIEGFSESPRNITSIWNLFEAYLLPITHIFNAMAPDIFGNPGTYNFFGRGFYRETILYIGLVPLIFSVYAFFKAKTNKIIYFFAASAIVSFFLTLKSPLTEWLFQLPIPLITTFLPSRILVLTAFSLSALSAFGFSTFINKGIYTDKKMVSYILLFFFLSLFMISFYSIFMMLNKNIDDFKQLNYYIIRSGYTLTKTHFIVMLKNITLPLITIFLIYVALHIKKPILVSLIIIVITIFGQFYFLNKYLVVGEPQFLYPKNSIFSFLQSRNDRGRFISLGQPIQENTSTIMNTYSIEGVNPIFPKRYGQLLFAIKNNGKITNNIPRVEARLSEINAAEQPFENVRFMKLMSLLNARYIFYYNDSQDTSSVKIRLPFDVFKPIWDKENWHASEYRNALPRVFLSSNIYIENNPQKILDLIFNPDINLLTTVILEEKPAELANSSKFIELSKPSTDSSARITSYEPQEIIINIKTNVSQMLFLSDNYYPGWKAYIDNKETKIYRADYTFRSIYLPAGNHIVKFAYEPLSFKIGLIVSILSVVLLLIIFVSNKYINHKK